MKLTTTLNRIRACSPCASGWKKLIEHLGKEFDLDAEINLLTILGSNGVADMLWCLRATVEDSKRTASQLAIEFAAEVLPIFEARRPNDPRPRDAIQGARDFLDGKITMEKLRRLHAHAAAHAANDAAYAANDAAHAAHAAYAAAHAAYAAAHAAHAAYAAYAANDAAYAANDAAHAAHAAYAAAYAANAHAAHAAYAAAHAANAAAANDAAYAAAHAANAAAANDAAYAANDAADAAAAREKARARQAEIIKTILEV